MHGALQTAVVQNFVLETRMHISVAAGLTVSGPAGMLNACCLPALLMYQGIDFTGGGLQHRAFAPQQALLLKQRHLPVLHEGALAAGTAAAKALAHPGTGCACSTRAVPAVLAWALSVSCSLDC